MTFIIEGHTSTNLMTAQSGITLPNSKVHFSTVVNGSAEGDGILRRDDYGEATDIQINQKCKQMNDTHTI